MAEEKKPHEPKYKEAVMGFSQLALGFSVVIAIAIGVGVGLLLRKWFGYEWLLWLGVFWGVSAGGLNIYKAYKQQFREMEKLKDDPKYSYKNPKDSTPS
ncbi:AtpZ/AtpI family protein [Wolinella succinogenes]|uniref:AtpZ/AtpI family protein n=1 Tax=Wolinella succinogenes TaxID=844 RepID=UPI000311E14C|nr:AtpZ/AtpI family protein [Wolinella succinogenes]VEG81056.1 Putative F0F1-ATPase subunit (ATPase_gene1) [Wolinella succinogenes]